MASPCSTTTSFALHAISMCRDNVCGKAKSFFSTNA